MHSLLCLLALVGGAAAQCSSQAVSISDALFTQRVIVTNEAKGARCAVAADFDGGAPACRPTHPARPFLAPKVQRAHGDELTPTFLTLAVWTDGMMDLISASSTDNTVAWYRNEGGGSWSTKKDITYVSNGARIVTVGDVDADGDVDAIAASYYDNTIRWFENDGTGKFTATHIITQSAVNAQVSSVAPHAASDTRRPAAPWARSAAASPARAWRSAAWACGAAHAGHRCHRCSRRCACRGGGSMS